MFRYSKQKLAPESFETVRNLDANNRWVKLSELLPWDDLAEIYGRSFDKRHGAPSIDARLAIGAILIKHKLKLSDEETIALIQENPYMQYFLGLKSFKTKKVFDPSLFVTIRRRLGFVAFDEMTSALITYSGLSEQAEDIKKDKGPKPPESEGIKESDATQVDIGNEDKNEKQTKEILSDTNAGVLKVDATVCDQYIKYPTDLDLSARARMETERLIDVLCKLLTIKIKPRTYRQVAQQQYLLAVKQKRLSKRKRRSAVGQQLRYVKRNLEHLNTLLDQFECIPFNRRDYKIFLVIGQLYEQQYYMWKNKVNRCDHRIVNIYQPHVRPIVRGKAGKNVEFGSKISISYENGLARIDYLSWEAFNESQILIDQIELYELAHEHLPQKVAADQIYGTRENRRWCKENNIELQVKPLGRPPDKATSKLKSKKDLLTRNDLEGKFGEGKNGFNLNKVRAKLQSTSESWIAAIFFVMNINELVRRMGTNAAFWLLLLIDFICSCRPASDRIRDIDYSTPIKNRTLALMTFAG